jgi:hypothetical protein
VDRGRHSESRTLGSRGDRNTAEIERNPLCCLGLVLE